jgi:hypothetical protein
MKIGLGYGDNRININSLYFDAENGMFEVKVQIGITVETINLSKEQAVEIGLINPNALLIFRKLTNLSN